MKKLSLTNKGISLSCWQLSVWSSDLDSFRVKQVFAEPLNVKLKSLPAWVVIIIIIKLQRLFVSFWFFVAAVVRSMTLWYVVVCLQMTFIENLISFENFLLTGKVRSEEFLDWTRERTTFCTANVITLFEMITLSELSCIWR